ncbi:MAG: quinolinate synthase NadA [Chitinispirillia bacterium]|jgi:quinolinate synthase
MNSLKEKILQIKKNKKAVILSHTYQPGEIQDMADFVGDSYGLSVQATNIKKADLIIFCGVKFMAETAAILSPDKKVIMPSEEAGCPMADMITPDELIEVKAKYPDYLVMCYVNSTAEIKALSDICCTSSNALKIAAQIPDEKGIIFIPDKHLGGWVKEKTGHKMVLWDGFCPTHAFIKPETVEEVRKKHPSATLLIHPEAPKQSRDLADAVLSTGGMCEYVKNNTQNEYIIATETGIIHTLMTRNPDKKFYPLNDSIICPNMKMGSLQSLYEALSGEGGVHVKVSEDIADKAISALEKMIEMSK